MTSIILCVMFYSAPGPVRHLSFTEILDTSLRVSWSEPEDKNGIITGTSDIIYSITPSMSQNSKESDTDLLHHIHHPSIIKKLSF